MAQLKKVDVPRRYVVPVSQSIPRMTTSISTGAPIIDKVIFGTREVIAELPSSSSDVASPFPVLLFSESLEGVDTPQYIQEEIITETINPMNFPKQRKLPSLKMLEREKLFIVDKQNITGTYVLLFDFFWNVEFFDKYVHNSSLILEGGSWTAKLKEIDAIFKDSLNHFRGREKKRTQGSGIKDRWGSYELIEWFDYSYGFKEYTSERFNRDENFVPQRSFYYAPYGGGGTTPVPSTPQPNGQISNTVTYRNDLEHFINEAWSFFQLENSLSFAGNHFVNWYKDDFISSDTSDEFVTFSKYLNHAYRTVDEGNRVAVNNLKQHFMITDTNGNVVSYPPYDRMVFSTVEEKHHRKKVLGSFETQTYTYKYYWNNNAFLAGAVDVSVRNKHGDFVKVSSPLHFDAYIAELFYTKLQSIVEGTKIASNNSLLRKNISLPRLEKFKSSNPTIVTDALQQTFSNPEYLRSDCEYRYELPIGVNKNDINDFESQTLFDLKIKEFYKKLSNVLGASDTWMRNIHFNFIFAAFIYEYTRDGVKTGKEILLTVTHTNANILHMSLLLQIYDPNRVGSERVKTDSKNIMIYDKEVPFFIQHLEPYFNDVVVDTPILELNTKTLIFNDYDVNTEMSNNPELFFYYLMKLYCSCADIARMGMAIDNTEVRYESDERSKQNLFDSMQERHLYNVDIFDNNISTVVYSTEYTKPYNTPYTSYTEENIDFSSNSPLTIKPTANVDFSFSSLFGIIAFSRLFQSMQFFKYVNTIDSDAFLSPSFTFELKEHPVVQILMRLHRNVSFVEHFATLIKKYPLYFNPFKFSFDGVFSDNDSRYRSDVYTLSKTSQFCQDVMEFANDDRMFRTSAKKIELTPTSAFKKYISFDKEEKITGLFTIEDLLICTTNKKIYSLQGATAQSVGLSQQEIASYGVDYSGSGILGNGLLFVSNDRKRLYILNNFAYKQQGVTTFVSDALPLFSEDLDIKVRRFITFGTEGYLLLTDGRLLHVSTNNQTFGVSEFHFGDDVTVENITEVKKPSKNFEQTSYVKDVLFFTLRKDGFLYFGYYTHDSEIFETIDGEKVPIEFRDVNANFLNNQERYEAAITTVDFDKALADNATQLNKFFVSGENIKDFDIGIAEKGEIGQNIVRILQDDIITIEEHYKNSSALLDLSTSNIKMHKRIRLTNRTERDAKISLIIFSGTREQM